MTCAARSSLAFLWLLAASCTRGPVLPAALDARNETCRFCRMAISDARFAAQLAAPGEEHLFFDDIGCLRNFLANAGGLRDGAAAFVADHRTKEWVSASAAIYTRSSLETPMGSRLIAHVDAVSRGADPAASGRAPLRATDIFGVAGPAGRSRGTAEGKERK